MTLSQISVYNFFKLCYSGSTNAKGTPRSEYLDTSATNGSLIEFCYKNKDYLNAKLFHHHFRVAFSEDLILSPALAAFVICHIFDDSQYGHSQVLEHLNALDHIDKSQPLRSRHDHSAIEFHLLAKTDLHIPSPWWEVDHQIVQLTPSGLEQQLWQDLRDHYATHGCWLLTDETERHAFHCFVFDGLNLLRVLFRRT